MTNKQRQEQLLRQYYKYAEESLGSIMGLCLHCQNCIFQIGARGSPTHNDQTNNCKASEWTDEIFSLVTPCATAYNRMLKNKRKERK